MSDRFYFRQLLSGRDFATSDPIAQQMVNFVYAIGDRQTGEALLVDPAYDVNGLVDVLEADGMTCTGVLATHYHPDHIGGSMMGFDLEGIAALLDRVDVPIHVQADEAEYVKKVTGIDTRFVIPVNIETGVIDSVEQAANKSYEAVNPYHMDKNYLSLAWYFKQNGDTANSASPAGASSEGGAALRDPEGATTVGTLPLVAQ